MSEAWGLRIVPLGYGFNGITLAKHAKIAKIEKKHRLAAANPVSLCDLCDLFETKCEASERDSRAIALQRGVNPKRGSTP
jgi:hypothetical protein